MNDDSIFISLVQCSMWCCINGDYQAMKTVALPDYVNYVYHVTMLDMLTTHKIPKYNDNRWLAQHAIWVIVGIAIFSYIILMLF